MTKKYERLCWNCGSRNMENKGSHVQCRSCLATWNEVAQLEPPIVEPGNVLLSTPSGEVNIRATHPTPIVKRRATLARAKS